MVLFNRVILKRRIENIQDAHTESFFINIPIIFREARYWKFKIHQTKHRYVANLNPGSDKFVYNLSERRVILVLVTPQT